VGEPLLGGRGGTGLGGRDGGCACLLKEGRAAGGTAVARQLGGGSVGSQSIDECQSVRVTRRMSAAPDRQASWTNAPTVSLSLSHGTRTRARSFARRTFDAVIATDARCGCTDNVARTHRVVWRCAAGTN